MKKILLILGTALAINANAQVVSTLAGSTTLGTSNIDELKVSDMLGQVVYEG